MASAPKELVNQVLGYFEWAWKDDFEPSTEIRKLYPADQQWLQLKIVFDECPWVKDRHIKLPQKIFEPKKVKTIQNVADAIADYAKKGAARANARLAERMKVAKAQLEEWANA